MGPYSPRLTERKHVTIIQPTHQSATVGHHCVSPVSYESRTSLLRWNDYLTGRTCTLKIADSDAASPVSALAAKYLTSVDPISLADNGMILPESVASLLDIQDVVHSITDDGRLSTIVPGTIFRSGARELSPQDVLPTTSARVRDSEVDLIDLTIDRSETGYPRNWAGFNRRRWERHADEFLSFAESSAQGLGEPYGDDVLALDSHDARVAFLKMIAKAIWDSPFENYSRFTGRRLRYKTGDEALISIIEGRGAICSEKVQALKFVTDRFGFDSHYVFAGPDVPGPIPLDPLRHVLETFDFREAGPAMRYWQHMALEFQVDGEHVLVDATNGNIPFMFIRGPEVAQILDAGQPRAVPIQMGTYPEDFYYHRAPRDLALDLCYAMEHFIPEIDLVQVFDNELGLAITPEFLVSPLPYPSDAEFDALVEMYERLAEPSGLAFDADAEWRLDGPVGSQFREVEPAAAELVLDSYEHLLDRYGQFEDNRHEMGLAIIRLRASQ